MSFHRESMAILEDALQSLSDGFSHLPESSPRVDWNAIRAVLESTAARLHDNYPFHHPLYVGQMLKAPHPVARLAYALAMWLNPNNHALDGGRASSEMEKESVAQMAAMFGWDVHLGHLCGGGTMANCEGLWVGRELNPSKAVAASSQAHYTHSRLSSILGVPFCEVNVDTNGRMDMDSLESILSTGSVGTVVATLGTTASGAVDPLDEILVLREKHGFRLHVDAAYGGYFTLANNLNERTRHAFDCISEADSIVVDPHKHGLQPYGCGCILFRDPGVGRVYHHDSPYTYFTSDELHLGEISLECSRPGAAAVGLWSTLKLLPLERGAEFAQMLEQCREGALALHHYLEQHERFAPVIQPDLDIVLWAVRAPSASRSSALARGLFNAAARHGLHLALAEIPNCMLGAASPVDLSDMEKITCLRACLMKPEHQAWLPEIISRLETGLAEIS